MLRTPGNLERSESARGRQGEGKKEEVERNALSLITEPISGREMRQELALPAQLLEAISLCWSFT